MPCYHPIDGYLCQRPDGGRFWVKKPPLSGACDVSFMAVPCGKCVGCRLERSRQWAVRSMHEASLYSNNCFITLTYAPEHVPADFSLNYTSFQLFMKRLRSQFKGFDAVKNPRYGLLNRDGLPEQEFIYPIRFFMCGEYGEQRSRPHFHAILYNFDFEDRKFFYKAKSGFKVYKSAALNELWPFGHADVGSATFQSAAYIARYVMKKRFGDVGDHYDWVDPDTGEVHDRMPEFNRMSLKPGIGSGWLDKFSSDVYPNDYVVINGVKAKPPRFYDKRYECSNPLSFAAIRESRLRAARERELDNTPERLHVKETVINAKVSRLKRSIA